MRGFGCNPETNISAITIIMASVLMALCVIADTVLYLAVGHLGVLREITLMITIILLHEFQKRPGLY